LGRSGWSSLGQQLQLGLWATSSSSKAVQGWPYLHSVSVINGMICCCHVIILICILTANFIPIFAIHFVSTDSIFIVKVFLVGV
jgi:hypothetical protein